VRRLTLLVCFIISITSAAQAPQSKILPLPWNSWQFHSGNDPRCATIDGNGCTVHPGINPSEDDDPVDPQEWQRISVALPASLQAPQQLGLLVEDESCFYQVLVNGHFIGARGDLDHNRGSFASRAIFPFSSNLAQNGHLLIAIRASTTVYNEPTGLSPSLGPIQLIRAHFAENTVEYFQQEWQHYLCFLLVFCVGLFFGLLFVLDRASTENLWLALILCAVSIARFFFLFSTVDIGLSSLAANACFFSLQCLISVSTIQFSFSLMRKGVWPIFRVLQVALVSWLIECSMYLPASYSTQLSLTRMDHFMAPVTLVATALSVASFLLPLPFCFRSRRPEMHWIGAALLFLFFEDANRYLGEISAFGLPHIPTLPQQVSIGKLEFDIRAVAYLLFAVVMLLAMSVRFRRIQSRNLQVESDLEAARKVQNLLILSQTPVTPGFIIESVYLPAQEVGGDFFHIAPAPDGSVLVVVGDVSGKGLSAAMTVSAIIGALRADLAREPAEVLTHLNQALHGLISGFATCCVAHLTPGRELTLANAGHLSPYRNGAELSLASALPLGLADDAEYSSESFTLQPGDHLTFVSDGVVEMVSHSGELFGFTRTAEVSDQSAASIAQKAQNFGAGMPQADDITVLTLDCAG
jgi:hypothetical protein